jgi:putative ABC transport system permease protein
MSPTGSPAVSLWARVSFSRAPHWTPPACWLPATAPPSAYCSSCPQPRPASSPPITAVADLKAKLVAALPDAQVTDYRESSPAITNGLDGATSLLSLMSLVALVLGAVGVAMAMRAHLQQRLDTIAIMKSLGAGSSQIIKIYVLQTLFLGILGGLIGVVGGMAVQLAFPFFLAKLINVPPEFHLQLRAVFTGSGRGRPYHAAVSPCHRCSIFAAYVRSSSCDARLRIPTIPSSTPPSRSSQRTSRRSSPPALILIGLAVVAMTLSDSYQVGKWFSIGLVLVLLILLGASAALLAVLKFFLNRTRLHLPSSLRHGLANLYRPGNPSAALLAALGLGVMQIMTVYLVQKDAVKEMNISAAPNLPNVFLIDIADSEISGVKALLHAQPSVRC